MRIGLTAPTMVPSSRVVDFVGKAEQDGFSSVWFPGGGGWDPLPAIGIAGRETERIELGTAIQQTYLCHPIMMAQRAAAAADVMGRSGFTLGIGPGHAPAVEGIYRESYDHAGSHTESYTRILTGLLAGEEVNVESDEVSAAGGVRLAGGAQDVPVLVAALGPRLLRVAGEASAGTILWMANAASIRDHVAPRITAASSAAPRIVAGLPVAVHDDVDEARDVAGTVFANYGELVNYQRILAAGGIDGPSAAAIVGDEASVAAQIEELFAAGATDVWAGMFPVGEDRRGSLGRTRALLAELANS